MNTYRSQAARDALAHGEGYANYIEESEVRMHDLFMRNGDAARAASMLTRTLGEALAGNDGE